MNPNTENIQPNQVDAMPNSPDSIDLSYASSGAARPEVSGESGSMSLPPVAAASQPAVAYTPAQPIPVAANPEPVAAPLQGTAGAKADDVDVIEPVWVNSAKKIVKETHGDPHAQEERVSQLQAEYMKKRYGKEIRKV